MHLTHLPAFNLSTDDPHLFDNIYQLRALEIRNTNISYLEPPMAIVNVESVVITDNPQLLYLSFFIQHVGLLNISNNGYDAHAKAIGNLIGLTPGMCIIDTGSLVSAHDMYFQNCAYMYMSNLINVTNSLVVLDTLAENLETNVLTSVGGDFLVKGALAMSLLNADHLQSVNGSFRIENATYLDEIHIPALQTIGRDFQVEGELS